MESEKSMEYEKTLNATEEIYTVHGAPSEKDIYKNISNSNTKANFWVGFLKTMTTIFLVICLIASFAGGLYIGYFSHNTALGMLAFFGLAFLSFISVSSAMVFLHLAEDVSIIRKSITKDK